MRLQMNSSRHSRNNKNDARFLILNHTLTHTHTHSLSLTHTQAQKAVAASKAAARERKKAQQLVNDEKEVAILVEKTKILVSEENFVLKQFMAKELEVLVRHFRLKPKPNARTKRCEGRGG